MMCNSEQLSRVLEAAGDRAAFRTRSSLSRSAFLLWMGACTLLACTYPATEVVVSLNTDAPIDRVLTIRAVTYRVGAGPSTAPSSTHTWVRGGSLGNIALPGTFAVVPGAGNPRDLRTTIEIDASLAGSTAAEPTITFRRIARFAFVPNTTARLPIFLAVQCGSHSTGCNSVTPDNCTVSVRCEEQHLTCGDNGACVSTDVTLLPLDGGGLDASTRDSAACPDGSLGCSDAASSDVTRVDVVETGIDSGPCPGVCTPGQTGGACGNCGTMMCDSTCNWTCAGSGCMPGDTSGSCGNCGLGTRTCNSSCNWVCMQGGCNPGNTNGTCGLCNLGTRTCNSSCSWTCVGGGTCSPGATRTSGTCCLGSVCQAPRTQTCSSSCSWVSDPCGPCTPPC